jgi:endonuclease-3
MRCILVMQAEGGVSMKKAVQHSGVLDAETLARRRRQYAKIAELLEDTYGYPAWRPALPPVDELVSTILSQNTNDGNRDRAFDALTERYSSWEAVRDAPVEDIVQTIRSAGLANQKGPRIQAALRYITETQGEISLDFLADMEVEEAKAWLMQIDGVGPKTAAIILLFSFDRPAFPVDTHIHRVTKRLGLIDPDTTAERAHQELEAIIPPDQYFPAHLNIIRHGREICHARHPRCEECPLTAYCEYYQTR